MALLRDDPLLQGGAYIAKEKRARTATRLSLSRLIARSTTAQSTYRADIDGLRAIAVFGVILMHAGVMLLHGGFLGVDIFFVISGYLVHQQVVTRLHSHTFSLRAFYGRRIRRIFPALYVVATVSLLVGVPILMPGDLIALARSAIAAAFGVSNIFFAAETGYFAHDAITKPLLHGWSLGVEEQFYLLAPLIPFALRRLSARARVVILVGLFFGDLLFCVIAQSLIPEITFFMMPPRLWEFLAGSLIAEGYIPAIKRSWIAECVSATALAALIASMVFVSPFAPHPGLPTLVPCLATAALIHVGTSNGTSTTRLLGATPLAFCGLISYSLYLWHWPLLVYASYMDLARTPAVVAAGLGLLLLVSIVSWKYVETPFRDPQSLLRRRAAPILICTLFLITTGSAALIGASGLPDRLPPQVAAVASYYDYLDRRDFREGTCFITSKYGSARYFDHKDCLTKSTTEPNYLLIGDSHAAHFWAGFSRVFHNIHILQATASGCKPVLGTQGLGYCVDLMHQVLIDFLPKAKLDGVIFSAAWSEEDIAPAVATLKYAERFAPHVILLGNIPIYQMALPNLLARSLIEHRPDLVFAHESGDPFYFDRLFKAKIDQAHYVSLIDLLCPMERCLVYAGPDTPLQFDTSHLTTEGSILVTSMLAREPLFAPLVEGRKIVAAGQK